jgi:hypothetical protein
VFRLVFLFLRLCLSFGLAALAGLLFLAYDTGFFFGSGFGEVLQKRDA